MGRNSLAMAAGTMASRLTGLARLAVLAGVLGYTGLADAYNLANTTPNIVYDLVAGGVLSATVLPVFVDRLTRRPGSEGWGDIGAVVSLATVVLVVVSALFALVAPEIIHLYELNSNGPQAAASAAVATTLLRLFALQVLCYGGVTLLTAALNARGSFAAPAFAPAVNNLVVIGVLLLVGASYGHRNLALAGHDAGFVLLLGLGTTAGVVAQLLTLLPALGRARIRLRWRWDPGNAAVRSILRLSGWTIGSVVANQVTLFVILTLAHGVNPDGGASAWTYAYTFFQLPFGIIAVSIMSVVQPELASSWALGRIGAFRRRLTAGLRATLGAVLPAAVGYLVLAGPIVDLVLEHGAARTGTASTGGLLAALALGLPGFSAYLYLTRAYQAMQDTRTVFVLYLVENAVNIVLAVVLAGPLGLVGLGLALSVAYTVAALLALWSLGRGGLGLTPHRVGPALGRLTPPCIAMAIAVLWVQGRVGGPAGVALVARVAASVGLGVSVFALVAVAGTVLVGARGARGAGSGRHRQRR